MVKKWNYVQLFIDGKRVLEHRYVMEKYLGRKLKPNEIVHHINKNQRDNDIKNLKLTTTKTHMSHHKGMGHKDLILLCDFCPKKFTRKYNQRKESKGYKNNFCSKKCMYDFSRKYRGNGMFRYKDELDSKIKSGYKEGLNGCEIAKKYNLNKTTVYSRLKKWNLKNLLWHVLEISSVYIGVG